MHPILSLSLRKSSRRTRSLVCGWCFFLVLLVHFFGLAATFVVKDEEAKGVTTAHHDADQDHNTDQFYEARGAVPTRNETQERHSRSSRSRTYLLLGVSGTLQDGFPLRGRLDYNSSSLEGERRKVGAANVKDNRSPEVEEEEEEYVPAIFIGRALVRGVKAYLDIKDPGSREYVAPTSDADGEPSQPPCVPNAVVLATGCHEHANLYHIYAVDHRQVVNVLVHEPRFLGIAPDTGLIDLATDGEEGADDAGRGIGTDDSVRKLALQLARRRIKGLNWKEGGNDDDPRNDDAPEITAVAIPLVIGVHFHRTYVESPIVHVLSDGTAVTSYAESLALWAGTDNRNDLGTAPVDGEMRRQSIRDDAKRSTCSIDNSAAPSSENETCDDASSKQRAAAWERVHRMTRTVERSGMLNAATHPATVACRQRARLGVGPSHVRLSFALGAHDVRDFL